jgi:hypothetical protein
VGVEYLKGSPWSSWTRDERYFCSVLHAHAAASPGDFAKWLRRVAAIDVGAGPWDVGFEVCFYRDYLWQLGVDHRELTTSGVPLPLKRTFDLCLFGPDSITVIEAKVCEPFSLKQNRDFAQDVDRIRSLPGLDSVRTSVVALASSKYYDNVARHGRRDGDGQTEALSVFRGHHVRWLDAYEHYGNPLLLQADQMYKAQPAAFIGGPS